MTNTPTVEIQTKPAPIKPLTREEMKVLRAKKIPNLVCDVLEGAYREAGVIPPEPPKPEPRWTGCPGKTMTWGINGFGSVAVEIQGSTLGPMVERGITCFSKINMPAGKRPDWLVFRLMAKPLNGTRVIHAVEGKITGDFTDKNLPLFNVRVYWNNGVPSTRADGVDNVDLVLLDNEGSFVQLQVGVTTRSGHFWLSFQEVYAGQVVRTTSTKAKSMGLKSVQIDTHTGLALPLYQENGIPSGLPGSDFLAINGMAHGVIPIAFGLGRTKVLTKCPPARWETEDRHLPEELAGRGWQEAWCFWFNAVLGWGFLMCEDGESCYVHFKSVVNSQGCPIVSNGEFPILEPQRTVALRWEVDQKRGTRRARSVQVLPNGV